MNYIKEINAFYDWLETNSISSSSIVLWHALMSINNKTGWKPEFTVAISTLEIKTSSSKKTIERARNNLKTMGLIHWRSRKGKQSAVYQMNSIQDILWGNNDAQSVPQPVPQGVSQSVPQGVAITKRNETKRNETKDSGGIPRAEASGFFARNFNNHSPYIHEKIEHWENDLSPEIVMASMKIALDKNAKHFNFCESILQEWYDSGLKTIEDVRAYETQKKKSRRESKHASNRRSNRGFVETDDGFDYNKLSI